MSDAPQHLSTERLTLRPWREADAEKVCEYASEWDLARMTSRIPHPYSYEMAAAFVRGEGLPEGEIAYAVDCGGELAGAVGLSPGEAWELGYWTGAPHRRRGYAAEAAAAMCEMAFATLRAGAVSARVNADNPASQKLMARLGFQHVGAGEGYSRARGETAALELFRLTAADWAAARRRSWRGFRVETERLDVTPLWASDAADLQALGDDREIARMMSSLPHPFSLAQAQARIQDSAFAGAPGFRAAIRRREDGALLGEIGLGAEAAPSVSYWIGAAQAGRGYASEAMQGFLPWAAEMLGQRRLTAEAYADNPASIRVLEKLGFRLSGERVGECSALRPPGRIMIYDWNGEQTS